MSMEIQITQQDIDNGRRDHVAGCAIALGLKHEFAYEISVSRGWIWIGKDYYRPTPEVRHWIADFDRGKPVKPITIELVQTDVPEKDQPKFTAYIPHHSRDIRKAQIITPAPPDRPDRQVCGIARIADSHD